MIAKRDGRSFLVYKLKSAGMSLREAKSPVMPKIMKTVGCNDVDVVGFWDCNIMQVYSEKLTAANQ